MKHLFILLSLCCLSTLSAVETQTAAVIDAQGFAGAVRMDGVGLNAEGYLYQVPAIERLHAVGDSIVWSVIRSAEYLFAGVGETGTIHYYGNDGSSGQLPSLGKFMIKALAIDHQDRLLAGGPDGIIYRFTGISEPEAFAATGTKYIWSLATAADGTCYAGTGPEGKIFKITPEGGVALLFDGEEKHILDLVLTDDTLYASTAGRGMIYAHDLASGQTNVLAQIPGNEIIALELLEDGALAALPGAMASAPSKTANQPKGKPAPSPKMKKSSIFRIEPETGLVSLFFESPAGSMMSMAVLENGDVIAGGNDKGLLYVIRSRKDFYQTAIADARQVTVLIPDNNSFLAGTAKTGLIGRGTDKTESVSYTSAIMEIGAVDVWGIAQTEIEGNHNEAITWSVRCGKTPDTDEGWSEWTEVKAGDITLPRGITHIQHKVDFKAGTDAEVYSLQLRYLPVNRGPEIIDVKIKGTGIQAGNKPPSGSGNGPVPPPNQRGANKPKGIQLMWKAGDPDNDPLVFNVALQYEKETTWVIAADELETPKLQLDVSDIPDGVYAVRLQASDVKANPSGKGQIADYILPRKLIIDNTAPVINVLLAVKSGQGISATAAAADKTTAIASVDYRINNGDWIAVIPEDHLFDELEETFSIKHDESAETGDVFILRCRDAHGNTAVARTVISE